MFLGLIEWIPFCDAGQFGRVFLAFLSQAGDKAEQRVAVKTMKCKLSVNIVGTL